MKVRQRALYLSLGLNLAALAVIFHLTRGQGHGSRVVETSVDTPTPSNLPTFNILAPVPKPDRFPGVSFDWRHIESKDYKQYVANLRAIGCPEKTVQDIIRADVKELFDQRRSLVRGTNSIYQFWRSDPSTGLLTDEQRAQLTTLTAEKREVLRSLIGVDEVAAEDFEAGLLNPLAEVDRRLGFLPANKRHQLKLILAHEADPLSAPPAGEAPNSREAIQRLLSEQELFEYDLRESVTASILRAGLEKAEPSEEEFRLIYRWWQVMEDAKRVDDSTYQTRQAESEVEIRKALGQERFTLYLEGMRVWGYSR